MTLYLKCRFDQAQLDVVPTAECNQLWVRSIVGGLIKGTPGSQARILLLEFKYGPNFVYFEQTHKLTYHLLQKFLWYRMLSLVVESYLKTKTVIGEDQECYIPEWQD